jgi:VWFA-related protein
MALNTTSVRTRENCAASAGLALLLTLAPFIAVASQQQSPQADEGDFVLSGEEVLLDLVATDGKGRPVLDLKAEEIEVSEGGQRQTLTSFGLVGVGPDDGATGPASRASGIPEGLAKSPYRNFNLIIIAVDRSSLRPQSLKQTYKAGERFVQDKLTPYDLVAVCGIGRTVTLFQNFTNDKPLILKALERVTSGPENIVDQRPSTVEQLARVFTPSRDTGTPTSPQQTNAELTKRLDELAHAIAGTVEEVRAQVEARAVIYGLLALTKVYASVPGRKSLVLYSEGFRVDAPVASAFSSVIGAANRNNFTFYTVDAAGLRTALETNPADDQRSRTSPLEGDRTIVVGGNSALGRTETALRSDDQAALNRLASETGGLALRNSNDLGRGLEAISNDLRSYYALSYSSTSTTQDGTFRPVSVRVLRKGVEVRTRSGYVAAPGGRGDIVLPYEPPILAMIGSAARGSAPANLDASVLVSYFPTKDGWLVPIKISVAAASVEPLGDVAAGDKKAPPAKAFEIDVIALVFDKDRNVVGKLSLPSTYHVPADKVAEFKKQSVSTNDFPRMLVLPPGVYRVAVGVYDPASKRGTVVERQISLRGRDSAAELKLSSLVLSRTAEPADDPAAAAADPFVFGGKARVIPNVDGRFLKSRGDRLIAYFRLAAPPAKQYSVQMAFYREGKVVVSTPSTPLTTDAAGAASLAPVFPLADFEPGSYVVQLTVSEPGTEVPVALEKTPFTLE